MIKFKNDFEKIVVGIVNDKFMIIMFVKFGIKCLYIIFIWDVFNCFVVIINFFCFKDKICVLMRCVILIYFVNVRVMIMVKRFGFIIINSKIIINKYGILYNILIFCIIYLLINVLRWLCFFIYLLNFLISILSFILRVVVINLIVNEIFLLV